MTLATVAGQPRAIDALQAALRSGAVHHAYLFAGPEGVGKELAAVGLEPVAVAVVAATRRRLPVTGPRTGESRSSHSLGPSPGRG